MKSEYGSMALNVVLEVKEACYGLWSARQAQEILRDETNVLARLAAVAQTAYVAGQADQPEVIMAQAEVTMLAPRLLELDAQIRALESKLNVLMGRAPDEPLQIAAPPLPEESDKAVEFYRGLAEKSRPEIRQAAAVLERARIERRLMGREALPDYRVGLEYRTYRNEEPDMAMFMVGIELPVWRGKVRAGIREADRMVASGQAALEAARQQAGLDAQQAYFNAKAAHETLNLYRDTLIPQAQARFEASEAGYRAGRMDFMNLLESERFLLEARIMAAMAEGEAGMQAARLDRALGLGNDENVE